MRRVDYIVVGLGLAGASLAIELVKRGKMIMVWDVPGRNRASSVAAGLFNPITGKMMTLTWNADRIFPFLHQWYVEAENFLGVRFFHPQMIYKPFISPGEQNDWMARTTDPKYQPYIERVVTSAHYNSQTKNPLGGMVVRQSGYVDVPALLTAVRDYLIRMDSYRAENFEHGMLKTGPLPEYHDIRCDAVIFCEGLFTRSNPFFSWLPLRPLSGEVLEIALQEKPLYLYNRQVYIVPAGSNRYKVGATYVNRAIESVTEEGRWELLQRLDELTTMSYKVVHQDWGIRPVVIDRKPLLGPHPRHKNIVVFNGLGTKGVSLAPFHAHQLCRWLVDGAELAGDTRADRFKSLYSKF